MLHPNGSCENPFSHVNPQLHLLSVPFSFRSGQTGFGSSHQYFLVCKTIGFQYNSILASLIRPSDSPRLLLCKVLFLPHSKGAFPRAPPIRLSSNSDTVICIKYVENIPHPRKSMDRYHVLKLIVNICKDSAGIKIKIKMLRATSDCFRNSALNIVTSFSMEPNLKHGTPTGKGQDRPLPFRRRQNGFNGVGGNGSFVLGRNKMTNDPLGKRGIVISPFDSYSKSWKH